MKSFRPLSIALVGLEPILGVLFKNYLAGCSQEFAPFIWDGGQYPVEPDVILANPHRSQSLTTLRRTFSQSFILCRVPWDVPDYWDHPAMDERLDELASLESIMRILREIRARIDGKGRRRGGRVTRAYLMA